MFGMSEWAIGVGVIILFGAAGVMLIVRFVRSEGARLKSRAVDPNGMLVINQPVRQPKREPLGRLDRISP